MKLRILGGIVAFSALLFGGQPGHAHPPNSDVTVVVDLNPMQGQLPESVARDQDGNLIISMAPQRMLWKLDPDDLSLVPFATLPVPDGASAIGVKLGPDGDLFACTAAVDPTLGAAHVWRVTPSGSVSNYAALDPNGFPNDIAIDHHGDLFVTDSILGLIYKVTSEGDVSTWLNDPALAGDPAGPVVGVPWGVNGIAFGHFDRHLYFSNTDLGAIYRVRVRHDGSPGKLRLFASDPRLVGADGIAFDVLGRLYVAVNSQNLVAKVNWRGGVSVVAQDGPLDGPSSVAFASDGFHRTKLYITSFALGTALSGGIPRPSIDSIDVRFGGLPLP